MVKIHQTVFEIFSLSHRTMTFCHSDQEDFDVNHCVALNIYRKRSAKVSKLIVEKRWRTNKNYLFLCVIIKWLYTLMWSYRKIDKFHGTKFWLKLKAFAISMFRVSFFHHKNLKLLPHMNELLRKDLEGASLDSPWPRPQLLFPLPPPPLLLLPAPGLVSTP